MLTIFLSRVETLRQDKTMTEEERPSTDEYIQWSEFFSLLPSFDSDDIPGNSCLTTCSSSFHHIYSTYSHLFDKHSPPTFQSQIYLTTTTLTGLLGNS